MPKIYFDNNATTYLDPVVAERMHELSLAGVANPASQHSAGRQALHLIEEAKSTILDSVGAPTFGPKACKLILTSGGTESNNLAIFGAYARRPGSLIVGATDHPSVIEAAKAAVGAIHQCHILPVDQNGLCDLVALEHILLESSQSEQTVSLVSVMLGNNETGVVQDLKTLCQLCHKFQVPVHSDVVQAVGKIPVDIDEIGLTALTLTGHKIHGPVGIGALIVRENFDLLPTIVGGGQQLGIRAGTEAVIPSCGLATALTQICQSRRNGEYDRIQALRDKFESNMLGLGKPGATEIVAHNAPRLPHTSNVSFKHVDRQALHMALDLKGLACSTGSACSSGSGRPSGSLVAMGLDDDVIQGSLRFSFSKFSTLEEVSQATEIIDAALQRCWHATVH